MIQHHSFSNATWKTSFLLSLLIAIAAQFQISLFDASFRISVGIICIPVFLFLFDDISLPAITFFSGGAVFLSRVLQYLIEQNTFDGALVSCFPEMFFYITYGLLLTLFARRRRTFFKRFSDFFYFILMDYAANFVELLLRSNVSAFHIFTQASILLIAVIRSCIIWLFLSLLQRYHLVLLKQEHAERYQKLMLLISKLNGEVIWMKKNTELIENTMNTSYRLFHELKRVEADEELTKTALSVAKDIHEIKKEYNLILRGISDALDMNVQDEGMYMREILHIVESSFHGSPLLEHRSFELLTDFPPKLYTDKHYFFMSIFRNLFTNALEAAEEDSNVVIQLKIHEQDGNYLIEICDNGPGIAKEDLPEIFHPGFSTKINYSTGEISRGLGLNLVQDLITSQLHGSICVASSPGNTTFTIQIPKNELEANS